MTGLLAGDHRRGGLADRQAAAQPVGLGVVVNEDSGAVFVAGQAVQRQAEDVFGTPAGVDDDLGGGLDLSWMQGVQAGAQHGHDLRWQVATRLAALGRDDLALDHGQRVLELAEGRLAFSATSAIATARPRRWTASVSPTITSASMTRRSRTTGRRWTSSVTSAPGTTRPTCCATSARRSRPPATTRPPARAGSGPWPSSTSCTTRMPASCARSSTASTPASRPALRSRYPDVTRTSPAERTLAGDTRHEATRLESGAVTIVKWPFRLVPMRMSLEEAGNHAKDPPDDRRRAVLARRADRGRRPRRVGRHHRHRQAGDSRHQQLLELACQHILWSI